MSGGKGIAETLTNTQWEYSQKEEGGVSIEAPPFFKAHWG